MFRLAICDDDTLHMQNTLRCARETPEAADCDIRTFSAPGELMDAVTGGGYRPHIALLDICTPSAGHCLVPVWALFFGQDHCLRPVLQCAAGGDPHSGGGGV